MTATAAGRSPRSVASVVAFTAFISALLAVGIDTALPAFDEIRSAFGLAGGSGPVSLVVTFYFLGMAVGQLPSGPLSDRFGRRPVLVGSLALYAFGALGSSLAPGFGLLLGFRFPDNFQSPYTARSLQDFWRRWHMTLSRWLRDYLYIPLGGSRGSRLRSVHQCANRILDCRLGPLHRGQGNEQGEARTRGRTRAGTGTRT